MARLAIASLADLPCPLCGDGLERGEGRQGLVWICRSCHGGAVTVPILRKFAPRSFVNALWQTALHRGRESALVCPACTHPFVEVAPARAAQIHVCVRCYWVWLDYAALDTLGTMPTTELPAPVEALPPPRRRALPAAGRAR